MGYRDDDNAQRLRVAQLEQELEQADRKIARLQGESPTGKRISGLAPIRLRRDVDGRLTEEGMVALSRMLDARMPEGGAVERSGDTLRWQKQGLMLVVEPNGRGGTHIAMSEGDTPRTPLILASVAITISALVGYFVLLQGSPSTTVFGGMALAVVALSLALAAMLIRRTRRRWAGIFHSAVLMAEQHRASAEAAGLRIAANEAEIAEEAAAEEQAAATEEQAVAVSDASS